MRIIDENCTKIVDDPRKINNPKNDQPEKIKKEGSTSKSLLRGAGQLAITRNLFLKTQKGNKFVKDEAGRLIDIKKDKDDNSKAGSNKILRNRGIEAGRSYQGAGQENKHGNQASMYPFLPIYSVGWFPDKKRSSAQSIHRSTDVFGFPRPSTFDPKPVLSLDFSSNARIRTPISNDFDDEEETNDDESPSQDGDPSHNEGIQHSNTSRVMKAAVHVTSSNSDEVFAFGSKPSKRHADGKSQASAEMLGGEKISGFSDDDITCEYSPSPSPPLKIGKSILNYSDTINSDSSEMNLEYSPTPTSSPDFYEKYKDVIPVKRPDLERVRYLEFYSDSPWTKRDDFYPQLSPLTVDSTHILIARNGVEPETARQKLSNGRKSMIPIFNWKLMSKGQSTNKDDAPDDAVAKSASDDDENKDKRMIPSPKNETNEKPLPNGQPSIIMPDQHVPRIRSGGSNKERSKELRQKLAFSTRIQALPNKPNISTGTKRIQTSDVGLSHKFKTEAGVKGSKIPGKIEIKPKRDIDAMGNKPQLELPKKLKEIADKTSKDVLSNEPNAKTKPKKQDRTEMNKTPVTALPNKQAIIKGTNKNQAPVQQLPSKTTIITEPKRNQMLAPIMPNKPAIITGAKRNNTPVKALANKPAIKTATIERKQTPSRLASKASLTNLPLLPNKSVNPSSIGKEGNREKQIKKLEDHCQQQLPKIGGNYNQKRNLLKLPLDKRPSPIGVEQDKDLPNFSGMKQEVKSFEPISTNTSRKQYQQESYVTRRDNKTPTPNRDISAEDILGIKSQEDHMNYISPISSVTTLGQRISNPLLVRDNRIDATLDAGFSVHEKHIATHSPDALSSKPRWDPSVKVRKEWEEYQVKRAEKSQLDHMLCSISPSHTKSEFSMYKPLPSISMSSAIGKEEKEVIGESPRATSNTSLISPYGISSKEVLPPIGLWSNESCCAEPRIIDGEEEGMDSLYHRVSSAGETMNISDGDGETKLSSGSLRVNKNLNSRDGNITGSESVISSVSSVSLDSYMDPTTEDVNYDDVNFCYFRILPSLCNGQTVPPLDLSFIAREEEMEAKKREQRDPESYYLFSSSEESLFSDEETEFEFRFIPKGRLILNPNLKDASAIIYKPQTKNQRMKRTIIGYHSDSNDWYKMHMRRDDMDNPCINPPKFQLNRSPFRHVGSRPITSGLCSSWCSCTEVVQTTSYGTSGSEGVTEDYPSSMDYTEGNTSTSGALSRVIDDDDEMFPTYSGYLSHETYTLTPGEWNQADRDTDYGLTSPVQTWNESNEAVDKMDLRLDLGDLLSPSDSDRNNSSAQNGSSSPEDNGCNFLKNIKKVIPCL